LKIRYKTNELGEIKIDDWELEDTLKYRTIHVERDYDTFDFNEADIMEFENKKIAEWKKKAESLLARRRLAILLTIAGTILLWPLLFNIGTAPFTFNLNTVMERAKDYLEPGYPPLLYAMRYAIDVQALFASIAFGIATIFVPPVLAVYLTQQWKRRGKFLLACARKLASLGRYV